MKSEKPTYTKISKCRSCGNTTLLNVADFGYVPIVNMGDKLAHNAPLILVYCITCDLLQLQHTVDPEYLFRDYYYKSGVNQTIRDDLESVVKGAMGRVELKEDDLVVDIGANDGTLLSNYPTNLRRVGFEPALNLANEAVKLGGIGIIPEFFSLEKAKLAAGKAKIITAISMFYDLDDPHDFLKGVKHLLADDGVFVIQQNYLPMMLRNNAFDNVVHEHLEYYSVSSLAHLLTRHGLYINDVEFNDINGGSFRTYIKHMPPVMASSGPGPPLTEQPVFDAAYRESQMNLDQIQTYKEFAHRVEVVKHKLQRLLQDIHQEGKLVYLAGASTRGNTLLNVAGISEFIKFAVERNPAKWGQTYNGIPIVSEKFAEDFPPDYYLILPWHFASEFFIREQPYLRKGGKMIFPLPKPAVVEVDEL